MKLFFIPFVLTVCAAALLTSCSGPAASQSMLPGGARAASESYIPTPSRGFRNNFLGCSYQTGDVWQKSIVSAPIDPNSAAYLKAITDAGGGGSFDAWAPTTDELVNMADNGTPLVSVTGKVKWHTPYSPWPWDSSFYIEPLSDAHAMVLQTQSCKYYEGYSVTYSNGSLSMYNGGMWDLTAAYTRPQYGAISTASGIPFGLLAVRPEELKAGVIQHALGWDGVKNTWSQTACVSPAAQSNCTDSISYNGPPSDTPIPYGAHIRLKASFNDSGFPTEAKIVAEALKTYGAYGYDTGCCNSIVFINDANGGPVWTSADESAISSINISDFDVVSAP